MKEEYRVLTLDDYEHRTVVHALNDLRTGQIEQQRSTEDVDDLIIKVIDAPKKRIKRRDHAR